MASNATLDYLVATPESDIFVPQIDSSETDIVLGFEAADKISIALSTTQLSAILKNHNKADALEDLLKETGISQRQDGGHSYLHVNARDILRLDNYAIALTLDNFYMTHAAAGEEAVSEISAAGDYLAAADKAHHLTNFSGQAKIEWGSDSSGKITLTLTDENGQEYVFRGKNNYDMRANPPVVLNSDGALIFIEQPIVPPITASEDGTVASGGEESDTFVGDGNSGDEFDGGGGRDNINGGRGDDRLTGGEGSDIFTFTGT